VIDRLFEAHLTVADLDRSVTFYRDVVGLELAHVVPARQAAFLWIGGPGRTLLGLWSAGFGPQRTTLHIAFATSLAEVIAAPRALRFAGVTPLDFDGRPTDEPSVIAWMPAAAIYLTDPDGHLLEYIAMLNESARPDEGVVPWSDWARRRSPAPE
jgi:lactoylglutathione lyase